MMMEHIYFVFLDLPKIADHKNLSEQIRGSENQNKTAFFFFLGAV